MKDENKKLIESKQETEEAFILLKVRYDELRDLNVKHVEVRPRSIYLFLLCSLEILLNTKTIFTRCTPENRTRTSFARPWRH